MEERPDLLQPDQEGMAKFKDIIDLVKEAAMEESNIKREGGGGNRCKNGDDDDSEDCKPKKVKKEPKK